MDATRFVLKRERIFLPETMVLTRGKAALLSNEHPVIGSIKPKLNVREEGDKIPAKDQRLNQSSISQVQKS